MPAGCNSLSPVFSLTPCAAKSCASRLGNGVAHSYHVTGTTLHARVRDTCNGQRLITMLLRNFFFWLSTKKAVTDTIARYGMRYSFARRFVAGETLDEALQPAAELCRAGRRVILNLLGENVTTSEDARRACEAYIDMLRQLDNARLDGNIAIKLTQLGLDFDFDLCLSFTQEIAAATARLRRTIEIDMEHSDYTTRTLDIYEATQRQ